MTMSDGGNQRLRLKQGTGWVAAGDGFAQALAVLSDGAFRLFAWLCLQAHRPSGIVETTHRELASTLGKSRRAMSAYIAELESKGVCLVQPGTNQYARTRFEITSDYWPYQREVSLSDPPLHLGLPAGNLSAREKQAAYHNKTPAAESQIRVPNSYVATVREMFLGLQSVKASFGPSDRRTAENLAQRGVPLGIVEDALLLGAARKYASWLNSGDRSLIGSLEYFRPVIDELERQPLPAEYRRYLRAKTKQFERRFQSEPASQSTPDSNDSSRKPVNDYASAKK